MADSLLLLKEPWGVCSGGERNENKVLDNG